MEARGFLAATILLLALLVVNSLKVTVRGLIVASREGVIDCDSMICPPETAICKVTKNSIPNDEVSYFFRHSRCLDSSGNIIIEQKLPEPIGIDNDNKTITLCMKADESFYFY